MAGPFDFLHIKGRTAGSSNELSFDVLDAARRELDEKRKANRASRPPVVPKPSQGSYTGVAGTSTLSAVPEVERRKQARRKHVIRVRVIAVLAVVALVSAGGFAGYRFYQDTVDFTGHFNALINRFVEVDRSLVEVDALMVDPLNSVEREARDQALAGFSDLDAKLEGLVQEAHGMSGDSVGGNDATSLTQVEEAARARQKMLSAAADTFKLSDIANRQVTEASEAWGGVLAGDAAAREASTIANEAVTEEATVRAREKTEEAIGKMSTARSQLVIIEQGVAGLSFSAEVAYIDKRLESLNAALETADALLANDRNAAVAANTVYNEADRAAAELAAALPVSIGDQVKSQYADEIAQKCEVYSSARAAATTADSALRSYMAA